MITKASPNKDLAYAFSGIHDSSADAEKDDRCDALHAGESAGGTIHDRCGEKRILHLDDPDAYMQRIYFWQDVPRRAKYIEIWNEVKAAQ